MIRILNLSGYEHSEIDQSLLKLTTLIPLLASYLDMFSDSLP